MIEVNPYLKNLGHLITDNVTDISREGNQYNNHVVHGPTNAESFGMIVKTIASRKINNVNFAADLMKNRYICVSEKSSWSMKSPNFVEKSSFARVL